MSNSESHDPANTTSESIHAEITDKGPSSIDGNPPDNAIGVNTEGHPHTPFWEKAAVLVALGLLIVNIFQMRATQKSANATKIASDTAATQLELNERPWVTVKLTLEEPPHAHSPGPSIAFNSDGTASLNAFVVVKNIGHSIAKTIDIRPQMYPPAFDRLLTEPIEKQKAWCDKVRLENPAERHLPSLFPGEEDTENFTFGMSRNDMEVAEKSRSFIITHAIIPVVYGCVTYRSDLSGKIYQTPFLYEMGPVPTALGTIPGSRLEIFKLFAGMAAN